MLTDTEKHKLTRADAAALIEKQPRGTNFYLDYFGSASMVDSDDTEPHGLRVNVKLTRAQAIKLVRKMLTDIREAAGLRIPVEVVIDTFDSLPGKKYRSVWIG